MELEFRPHVLRTSEAQLVACVYREEVRKLTRAVERRNAKIVALRAKVKMLVSVLRDSGVQMRSNGYPEAIQVPPDVLSAWQHDKHLNGFVAARSQD